MLSGCGAPVLDEELILRANSSFRLPERYLTHLTESALAFRADESAVSLAARFHGLFFHSEHSPEECQALWLRQSEALGARRGALAALLVMSGLGVLLEFYQVRGIPQRVLLDSLTDLRIWMEDFESKTGCVGFEEVGWLLQTMRGRLFRIGRLQFMLQPLRENIAVAVNRVSGLPVLFFSKSVPIREDGLIDGTNGIFSQNPFITEFRADSRGVEGSPIHPAGHALRKTACLDASEWHVAVQPGCDSLDVHIPKDGKMEITQCRASLTEAAAFFRLRFPQSTPRLFTLATWFLDPQIALILPSDSNIVRFQKEFYLYPALSDERFTYSRVFGDENIDMAEAPEDTALRKVIKSYVLSGGRMHSGSGILLTDHLNRLGETLYLNECSRIISDM